MGWAAGEIENKAKLSLNWVWAGALAELGNIDQHCHSLLFNWVHWECFKGFARSVLKVFESLSSVFFGAKDLEKSVQKVCYPNRFEVQRFSLRQKIGQMLDRKILSSNVTY